MLDIIEIGPCPHKENPFQVGTENYSVKGRIQCNAFREQLIRQFGNPPEGARFIIKSNPHDYGNYYEVAIRFDSNYPDAVDYAFKVEADYAGHWDMKSLKIPGIVCSED